MLDLGAQTEGGGWQKSRCAYRGSEWRGVAIHKNRSHSRARSVLNTNFSLHFVLNVNESVRWSNVSKLVIL